MRTLLLSLMLLGAFTIQAEDIQLAKPDTNKGADVMQTFAQRRSTREFNTKELSLQDMSNLLWATMGKSSTDNKLTAPSCLKKQEIRLFAFTSKGAYEYMPMTHTLRQVATGDFRPVIAGKQTFVNKAPLCLVMVADMEKFGSSDNRAMTMAAIDAGIVTENACIAAAGLGLASVPRATMDVAKLQQILGLSDKQIPLMNVPVGYFVK